MNLLILSFFLVLFEPLKLPLPKPKTTYGLAKVFLLILFLRQIFLLFKKPKLFNKKTQQIFLPLLFFVTINLFSFLKAYNISAAFQQINFLLTASVLFFLGFFHFVQKDQIKRYSNYFLIFTFFVGFLSVLSFFFLGAAQNLWHFLFPKNTLERYLNDLGRNRLLPYWDLEMITPLVLFFLLFGKKKKRVLALATLFFQGLAIFFSNTRYRLLTFLFGFVYLFLIKKKRKLLTLLPLLLLIPFALFLSKSHFNINLLERFLFQDPGLDLYSLKIRLIYLQETLKIFKKFPLLGIGPGNFPYFITTDWRYIPTGYFWLSSLGEHNVVSPHNIFLQVLAETGILGFLSFLWLLFSFAKNDLLLFKKKKVSLLLAISLSSWCYIFNNLTSIVHTSAAGMAYFLFLRAVLAKLYYENCHRS